MSQPPGGKAIEIKFTQPEGMIPVKCNQHPWEKAYIAALSHPFSAVTDRDGSFTIKGLPPGQYEIAAWHEVFGTQKTMITVRENKVRKQNFSFSPNASPQTSTSGQFR